MSMNDFAIAITTFSKRFDFVSKLISQIRIHNLNKIYLVINGEKDGNFNEDYRNNILNLCINNSFIYPIFFTEIRGLSKLWNTAIIASDVDNILVLNDDIEILSGDIFSKTSSLIREDSYTGLCKINGSFSHFVVNKVLIDKMGYFDERLLGFGEEDGDITYRFLKNNIHVGDMRCSDVINIVSQVRHDDIKPGIGKYSHFNRSFIMNEKYRMNTNSRLQGMFDYPVDQVLDDSNLYPYERFFRKNKNNL